MAGSSATDSSSESDLPDQLNLQQDDGWQDVEPEEDEQAAVCLFCDQAATPAEILKHCLQDHEFDLLAIRKNLCLDFYGSIKLINYIRSNTRDHKTVPDISTSSLFEDDKYLQPILEDDALLFSLDELVGEVEALEMVQIDPGNGSDKNDTSAATKVLQLEEQLHRLQSQFDAYRATVEQTLDERWNDGADLKSAAAAGAMPSTRKPVGLEQEPGSDNHYFESYSYNEIHETMLKDSIRTDAYRDFVYDNKDVFQDKIVLDVGCGTGILSMFCAKAGAKRVFAVDNSEIINKARANIIENDLDGVISCIKGKIEEITLPVPKVDIIISEWMGYCLLYEAMLDSVLWARDRYLAPDGLMVPSHVTLRVAAISDQDYIDSHISFWHSVYGFSMTSMLSNIYDDALIRNIPSSICASNSTVFCDLPLHTVTSSDLSFVKDFSVQLSQDVDVLDGFAIWFDTFFLRSRNTGLKSGISAEDWAKSNSPGVAFTTGPGGRDTHWMQAELLINHKGKNEPLRKGQNISGTIQYSKSKENPRELDIDITWAADGTSEKGKQSWFMR